MRDVVVWDREGILAPKTTPRCPRPSARSPTDQPGGLSPATCTTRSRGADVFIGVSAPDVLPPDWIDDMADHPIVFALANPDPEVDIAEASKRAAVVASGRSDYPNQINNVLAFPGVFRGLLDARAAQVTTDMLIRAADALASVVTDARAERQLHRSERLRAGHRQDGCGGHFRPRLTVAPSSPVRHRYLFVMSFGHLSESAG